MVDSPVDTSLPVVWFLPVHYSVSKKSLEETHHFPFDGVEALQGFRSASPQRSLQR